MNQIITVLKSFVLPKPVQYCYRVLITKMTFNKHGTEKMVIIIFLDREDINFEIHVNKRRKIGTATDAERQRCPFSKGGEASS